MIFFIQPFILGIDPGFMLLNRRCSPGTPVYNLNEIIFQMMKMASRLDRSRNINNVDRYNLNEINMPVVTSCQ
jgi:hypothetical protein